MSSSMALRRSPKPGAFTAHESMMPRALLTTRPARASPSTVSAITRSLSLAFAQPSSSGSRSFMLLIFFSWMRISGSSSTHSIVAVLVTK